MKKIGFIDLHIDEWHANNYPSWFNQAARGPEFELHMAYQDAPGPGISLEEWCARHHATPAKSIEQVVESCDALCVLAPSNPEVHERLADLPLRSGKPVYIDKPFAPDKASAERMFELAARYRTPMFSSSALRFSDELLAYNGNPDRKAVEAMVTWGAGNFAEYVIHQLEMIISTMGTGVKRVMYYGNNSADMATLEFSDSRRASLTLGKALGFGAILCGPDGSVPLSGMNHVFENLIAAILDFYTDGKPPVTAGETIEIAAILEALLKARKQPGTWTVQSA